MADDKLVDDIIAFLDRSVVNGVGHLNVEVNEEGNGLLEKKVDTRGNLDCAKGNMACMVPTLDAGIDNQVEENNK